MKFTDNVVVVVSTVCATAILITVIVSGWTKESIIGLLIVLASQAPLFYKQWRSANEIKQTLNGGFDDRLKGVFKGVLLETGLFVTDGRLWYLRTPNTDRTDETISLPRQPPMIQSVNPDNRGTSQ